MSKYIVVATRWSSEANAQIKVVVGQFDEFMYASIFRNAYNDRYSANAEIIEHK